METEETGKKRGERKLASARENSYGSLGCAVVAWVKLGLGRSYLDPITLTLACIVWSVGGIVFGVRALKKDNQLRAY